MTQIAHTKGDYPIPARAMHQINLLCIIILAATGFFIHKPNFSLFGMSMNLVRTVHFYAGFVIILNLLVRFYWALLGKPRDIANFLPQKENRGTLLKMISYYLFLRKTHPVTGKHNTLQKSMYVFWFFLLIFQAITGFSMLWKGSAFGAFVIAVAGGLSNIYAIHYLTMWVFVATTLVHLYMVLFEDFPVFMTMFFGVGSKEETT